jgi:hypothetical protein
MVSLAVLCMVPGPYISVAANKRVVHFRVSAPSSFEVNLATYRPMFP